MRAMSVRFCKKKRFYARLADKVRRDFVLLKIDGAGSSRSFVMFSCVNRALMGRVNFDDIRIQRGKSSFLSGVRLLRIAGRYIADRSFVFECFGRTLEISVHVTLSVMPRISTYLLIIQTDFTDCGFVTVVSTVVSPDLCGHTWI